MLKIGAEFGDSAYTRKVPEPEEFERIYHSPVVGLDNCWELWISKQGVAVISLRGTVPSSKSWLANFYAAMVPARGELHLSDSFNFKYELASSPRAAVHVGWLICTAFLSRDIFPKIDSLYKAGTKEFMITGHSQGGALSFLITSWLYSLQRQGILPGDIRFKTYCMAAPKVGNLYFAYDYEAMTQYGWAFNVVNSADWVPEGMFSIQTFSDFNKTNPFNQIQGFISKQAFPKNIVLKHYYNRMDKLSRKAEKRYQKYLGYFLSKYVEKYLPGFIPPNYYNSMDYVRVGNTIVLLADEDYYKLFPDNPDHIFTHHLHPPYLYLAEKLPPTP